MGGSACSPDVGVEDVADFEVDGPVGPHEQVARGLLDPRRRARRRRGRRPHDGPRRVHPPAAGDPGRGGLGFQQPRGGRRW